MERCCLVWWWDGRGGFEVRRWDKRTGSFGLGLSLPSDPSIPVRSGENLLENVPVLEQEEGEGGGGALPENIRQTRPGERI